MSGFLTNTSLDTLLSFVRCRRRASRFVSSPSAASRNRFSVSVGPRTYDTPLSEGTMFDSRHRPELGSAEHDEMEAYRTAYMSIVGGLLWLANMTFPELSYPASQLARFLTNPGMQHYQAAMRVLTYVSQSRARRLRFAPDATRGFEVYVDSNWATRFSCSGAMFFFHGCLFHWFSKMQHSVSLSSAEAEFFGAMLAAKDLLFLRDLFTALGIGLGGATVVHSDSKSAVDMSLDPVAVVHRVHGRPFRRFTLVESPY